MHALQAARAQTGQAIAPHRRRPTARARRPRAVIHHPLPMRPSARRNQQARRKRHSRAGMARRARVPTPALLPGQWPSRRSSRGVRRSFHGTSPSAGSGRTSKASCGRPSAPDSDPGLGAVSHAPFCRSRAPTTDPSCLQLTPKADTEADMAPGCSASLYLSARRSLGRAGGRPARAALRESDASVVRSPPGLPDWPGLNRRRR